MPYFSNIGLDSLMPKVPIKCCAGSSKYLLKNSLFYALDIYIFIIRSDEADRPHAIIFQFIKAFIIWLMTVVDEDVNQPLPI
jgi:hypothetical protein